MFILQLNENPENLNNTHSEILGVYYTLRQAAQALENYFTTDPSYNLADELELDKQHTDTSFTVKEIQADQPALFTVEETTSKPTFGVLYDRDTNTVNFKQIH